MLIRNMPGFSTFYAYSTHKQKNSRGIEKSGNFLIPTLEEYLLGKIGVILFSYSPIAICKSFSGFLLACLVLYWALSFIHQMGVR